MLDLKSLIITRNNQGPKHVPWDTPAETVSQITLDFLYHRASRGLFCSHVKVMLSQCNATIYY